jgi:XTP/dITP diphosphohydrolase
MRIVVATANAKKLVELERILDGLDVQLVRMTDLGLSSPVEDGDTFEANALIKARAAAAESGLPAVADDSGLEVDALGGAPGIYSSRYAGEHCDDLDNNRKLVAELAGVPEGDRTARFVCAAALVTPDGGEWVERGAMEGHIVSTPRGTNGFGYDPHFVSVGETRTNAELTSEEKDVRSHRGAAFRALRRHVADLITAT